MMFGAVGNRDHDDSVRIIHKAPDAGTNFVDTAYAHSHGESEEDVGKALKDRRDRAVPAPKARLPMGDDPNQQGNSRRRLVRAPPGDRPRRSVPDAPARAGHLREIQGCGDRAERRGPRPDRRHHAARNRRRDARHGPQPARLSSYLQPVQAGAS
jgi:hypothetical protein